MARRNPDIGAWLLLGGAVAGMVFLAKQARSQVEPKLNRMGVPTSPTSTTSSKPKVPPSTDPNRYVVIPDKDRNLCYDLTNKEFVGLKTCLESGTPSALQGSTLSSNGYGSLS